MAPDYPKMVAATLEQLPLNKQVEVYRFVEFLKHEEKNGKNGEKRKKGSVFDLFGTVKSKVSDASENHDKYL